METESNLEILEKSQEENTEQEEQVFKSLVVEGSKFFAQMNKELESKTSNIQLNINIKELKLKAFKEALGEAIRYVYYVSYALVKGEVKRADSPFDSATRLFEVISPTLHNIIPSESRSFKTDLAFSMLNALFEIIKAFKDAQKITEANKIVEVFQGGYGRIDVELVEEICGTFAKRFRDQIVKMTVSISTNGKLRLHEKDGVVQFANVIAKRIGVHTMQGKNEYVEESSIPFLQSLSSLGRNVQINLQKTFGEAQNIKAKVRLSPLQRCLMASWQELEGYDTLIECDVLNQAQQYIIWPAGDILTQTGIKDFKRPHMMCERPGYFNKEIGYIYGTSEEAKQRQYNDFYDSRVPVSKTQPSKKVESLGGITIPNKKV